MERVRHLAPHARHGDLEVTTLDGAAADERLEHRHAEREGVRVRVGRRAAEELGRHVGDGPHDLVAARERAVVHDLHEAEVHELRIARGRDDHVRRLHVAVDEPRLVDRLERGGDIVRDPHAAPLGERTAPTEVGEVAARDVLHGEEEAVLDAAALVEARDVGPAERAKRGDLAVVACERLGLDVPRRHVEDLERDRDPGLVREVDGPHASAP